MSTWAGVQGDKANDEFEAAFAKLRTWVDTATDDKCTLLHAGAREHVTAGPDQYVI
jgi:hypothetical protein